MKKKAKNKRKIIGKASNNKYFNEHFFPLSETQAHTEFDILEM